MLFLFWGGDWLKFGDVAMATVSAMVFFILIGFPFHLVLVSPLGYFMGSIVGSVIAILISGVIVGFVCADGVRDQNPSVSEEELIERVRERLLFDKKQESGD